jgi:site-specific DNA-methyltransferase (adenine-specific)
MRAIESSTRQADGARAGDANDQETATRFRYSAKASRAERDAGLEGMAETPRKSHTTQGNGTGNVRTIGRASSIAKIPLAMARNPHPTVKPLDLCRYLATLILPPESYRDDAALLVPFAGVASEMVGAYLAGWRDITGIELDPEYAKIGRARLAWWQWAYEQTGISDPAELRKAAAKLEPLPMLEMLEAAQ